MNYGMRRRNIIGKSDIGEFRRFIQDINNYEAIRWNTFFKKLLKRLVL